MTKQQKSKIEIAADKVTKAEANHQAAIAARYKAQAASVRAEDKVRKTEAAIAPARFAFDRIARELHTPAPPKQKKSKKLECEIHFSVDHLARGGHVDFASLSERMLGYSPSRPYPRPY